MFLYDFALRGRVVAFSVNLAVFLHSIVTFSIRVDFCLVIRLIMTEILRLRFLQFTIGRLFIGFNIFETSVVSRLGR